MHAGQVLDMQADLIDRFKQPYFRQIVKYTLNVDDKKRSDQIVNVMEKHVQNAYAYHVNADMSDLVMHAAHMLEDDDLADLSLPPTQIGIVRFDKALPLRDARGKTMMIHWMTWGPGTYEVNGKYESGIMSTCWNDLEEPDEVALAMFDLDSKTNVAEFVKSGLHTRALQEKHLRDFKHEMGRWSVIGTSMLFPGDKLGGEYITVDEGYAEQIEASGDTPYAFTNTDRYLHALWLLMNQTITTVEDETPSAAFRKRATKKNLPASRVTVIKLRRTSGSQRAEGESHVEWSHRWITRGHWRWQPCGTRREERRRIWINSYVKGPEGKPLVVTDKVYSLVR